MRIGCPRSTYPTGCFPSVASLRVAVRRGDAPMTSDCWSDGSADGVEQFPGLGPDLSKTLKSAVFLEHDDHLKRVVTELAVHVQRLSAEDAMLVLGDDVQPGLDPPHVIALGALFVERVAGIRPIGHAEVVAGPDRVQGAGAEAF